MRTRSRANSPRETGEGREKAGGARAWLWCGRRAWSRREKPPVMSRRGRAAYGSDGGFIVSIGAPAHPSERGSATDFPRTGEKAVRRRPIVLPVRNGPRMSIREIRASVAAHRRPKRTGANGNATTEVLDQAVPPAPPPDLPRAHDPDRYRPRARVGRVGRGQAR